MAVPVMVELRDEQPKTSQPVGRRHQEPLVTGPAHGGDDGCGGGCQRCFVSW